MSFEVMSELFQCLLAQEQPLMEAQLERRMPEDFLQQKYPSLGCCGVEAAFGPLKPFLPQFQVRLFQGL